MIDQRLFTYIEQELKRGVPNAAIMGALRDAGWAEDAIGQAFIAVQNRSTPPSPEIGLPEAAPHYGVIKTKKIRTKGRKLPLGVVLGVVGIIAVVLAAVWYFIFIAPGQQKNPDFDETAPNILKEKETDGGTSGGQNDEGQDTGNATTTASQGTAGELTVVPPDTLSQPYSGTTGGATSDNGTPVSTNDTKRREDLDKLAAAQKLWFGEHKTYYTCSLSGGDCGGKAYGLPEQVGIYLSNVGQDPLSSDYAGKKASCGVDYVYCGLNNVSYSNFFCYYAKLEGGGYYTVSHAGSAVRSVVPKVFEQCGVAE